MLSTAAFNGLLKTLEEPPPYVKFIFATTEIRKVPVTILSRCMRFDLRRVHARDDDRAPRSICSAARGIDYEPEALAMIVRAGEGSVRDNQSLLDQAIAHGDGKVTAATVKAMLGLGDRARTIDLFEELMARRHRRRARRPCASSTMPAPIRRRWSPTSAISPTSSPASRSCPPRPTTCR